MIVLLAIGIFVLFGILLSQSSFDLPFLNPDTNQQLLFFAALSAVIFLLFVALTFVLARNLLKLFAERRLGVLDQSSAPAWWWADCCSLSCRSS